MSDILSIGKSALLAAQTSLSVTGQNIANASVTGYSRQATVQVASPAQNTGHGFVGNGTDITTIQRYADTFLASQVNSAQSATSLQQTYNAQITQVDNMLADSTTGLSPAMQKFSNSVQSVSANPASAVSRQSMLAAANSLAASFNSASASIAQVAAGIDTQIASSVSQINSYAAQIAQLNQQIASVGTTNGPPNDLLDQRDVLVSELNQQITATVLPGNNNMLNVSIGNGQPLVMGNQAMQLTVIPPTTTAGQNEVGYVTGNVITPLPEATLSGGALGGLFAVRSNALIPAQTALDTIASGMAASFNNQQVLGLDQNGKPGSPLFTMAPPTVTAGAGNIGSEKVAAAVTDPSQITASSYTLKVTGTDAFGNINSFTLTPSPNGTYTTMPQTIAGVTYSVSAVAATVGDSFVIQPTLNAAASMSVALTAGTQIAAAAPIVTAAGSANTGSGTISAGSVDINFLNSPPTLPVAAALPMALTYDSATKTLTYESPPGTPASFPLDATVNGVSPGAPFPASVTYTPGMTVSFGGVSVVLSGAPNNNDTFTVGPNPSGAGDNRNAVLMGNLQSTNILDGGTATFQSAYAQLVSFVGNATQESQVNGAASAALLAQMQTSQQNVSGVNLDEEAANLLKYQQAYQAAGKVMEIASAMFATLLTIGGP